MTDERDSSVTSEKPESAVQSPGLSLKQEREKQGVTTQRIAADMHLSVAAIEAIEADRFATLGAPVFAKGHLRKYANLLGLPPDKIAELYDRLDGAPKQVDPIPLSQRMPEPALRPAIREMLNVSSDSRQRPASMGSWIAATFLMTMVIAAGAWWYWSHRLAASANREGQAPASAVSAPGVRATPSEGPSISAVNRSTPELVVATNNNAPPQRVARPAGTPPPGKVRVRLTFARDSWVEVYDVGGNRMLYDVGRVDMPRLIDVEPPALVVLGDASAVTTEANDKLVAIPQKNITGTVARFTIGADGSVR